MSDLKPVTVYRSSLTGHWYAAAHTRPTGTHHSEVVGRKACVSNEGDLECMWDSHGWLESLLAATGLNREQIADRFDLVLRDTRGMP